MSYEIGARVRLVKDVQVTDGDPAAGTGLPGPLFLAEGLQGVVTAAVREAGGSGPDHLAMFEEQIRGVRLDGHASALIDGLRQQIVQSGRSGAGGGVRFRYGVRFENGFVLHGVEEDWLSGT
ncbi:hypothetical protein AB6O49_00315 [Streptomyces sp. SBR177]